MADNDAPKGVELLALPEPKEAWLPTHTMEYFTEDQMQDYARANVEASVAELRHDAEMWRKMWRAEHRLRDQHENRAERLAEALRELVAEIESESADWDSDAQEWCCRIAQGWAKRLATMIPKGGAHE